jgi:hypothetical protein
MAKAVSIMKERLSNMVVTGLVLIAAAISAIVIFLKALALL